MLDALHLPDSTHADVQVFNANSTAAGNGWSTWVKRRGVSMCQIFVWGAGGAGGNGVVGAASTAAGGGGGGSSGQTSLTIPSIFLPDFLYVSVGYGSTGTGIASRVSVAPDTNANNCIVLTTGGTAGGNAAGATAGTAGVGGSITSISNMVLAGLGLYNMLAGQSGIVGGTTVAGGALTLPATGLTVTGGTGGGGLPAAAAVGTNGGLITVTNSVFPPQPGGIGGTAATVPGADGTHGISGFRGLAYDFGGTGGGSSHGSATGAGLVGGKGGKGGIGSGGGGGGGALTGSTQGTGGFGGDGQVIIISW